MHFGEIDGDRKDSMARHINFGPNWVGTDIAV